MNIIMQEDRKRSNELQGGDTTEHIKRLRAEDIIGDERKVTTRLLLNRAEFSLVIGKNGNTIAHIRNTFGANIKGSDIDAEYRIVIISGNLKQVIDSFDLITDLIHKAHQQSSPHDIFTINILLEHSKAGRVVGQKGSTIQGIKNRSGAHMMRLQKDPQEFCGVLLRTLSVEGHIHNVKRAHMFLQEVFHETHLQPNQTFFEGSGSIPLPFHSLTSVGVQAETVKQLGDMKKYLAINFGLEMTISAIPGMHASNVLMQSGYGGPSFVNDRPNPDDVQFAISKNSAGGIIGKGGQGLKELMSEFGLKVYIEKDVIDGTSRNVIISGGDANQRSLCQERIIAMSHDPQYFNMSADPQSTINSNEDFDH